MPFVKGEGKCFIGRHTCRCPSDVGVVLKSQAKASDAPALLGKHSSSATDTIRGEQPHDRDWTGSEGVRQIIVEDVVGTPHCFFLEVTCLARTHVIKQECGVLAKSKKPTAAWTHGKHREVNPGKHTPLPRQQVLFRGLRLHRLRTCRLNNRLDATKLESYIWYDVQRPLHNVVLPMHRTICMWGGWKGEWHIHSYFRSSGVAYPGWGGAMSQPIGWSHAATCITSPHYTVKGSLYDEGAS